MRRHVLSLKAASLPFNVRNEKNTIIILAMVRADTGDDHAAVRDPLMHYIIKGTPRSRGKCGMA